LIEIINNVQPDEIYHLAAQSHVRVSFDLPEYTGDVTALGPCTSKAIPEAASRSVSTRRRQRDVWQRPHLRTDRRPLSHRPMPRPLCLLGHPQLPSGLRNFRQ
jgi:hypothetical protein